MDWFEKARAVFNTYGTMDAPKLPEGRLQALQVRLHRGFHATDQESLTYTLVAVAGLAQALHHVSPGRLAEKTLVGFAVKHIVVHLVNICTSYRLDFGTLLENVLEDVATKGRIE